MERRTQYRVEVADDLEFRAELKLGAVTLPVTPIDVTAQGAGIVCDRGHPSLSLGDEVELRFMAKRVKDPIRLKAQVMNRRAEEDSTRYGLRFVNAASLREQFSPALLQLFNQRKAYRAQVPPGELVPVALTPNGTERSLQAEVVDISTSGVGVRGPVALESALAAADRVLMQFRLPNSTTDIAIEGVIRHGRLQRDMVFYGIEFLRDAGAGSDTHERAIVDYVMARQRDELRHRSTVARSVA